MMQLILITALLFLSTSAATQAPKKAAGGRKLWDSDVDDDEKQEQNLNEALAVFAIAEAWAAMLGLFAIVLCADVSFVVGRQLRIKKMLTAGNEAEEILENYPEGSTVRLIYHADDPRFCEILETAEELASMGLLAERIRYWQGYGQGPFFL